MDRELISLKFTLLRHSTKGLRLAGWILGALLVAATWAAAFLASGHEVRGTVLALVFAGWGVGAALGPVLTSGSGVLRPDYFALLPLPRARLGRGLLVSVFVSIASAYVLLAFLAAAVHALLLDPLALVVVIVGAPLTWIFAVTLSRIVYGLLGAAMRSKFGVEIAGIQFGLMFAAMFTGWMVVQVAMQSIPVLLERGLPDGPITTTLDALPTSWTLLAVESAADGDWGAAGLLLAALALIDVLLVLAATRLLTPRTAAAARSRRGRRRSARLVAGRGLLPRTQLGAVIGKELRQWTRDPWRSLELRTGVWTGIAIGFFAFVSGDYAVVSAFAGLIVAFMLGLGACNVYGQDGTAVWQSVVGQDETSIRSDVRGRQWAAIIVFLPQALLISAIFLVLGGHWWTVPILLAAIPAVFGAASGAAIVVSAVGVSPGVDPRRRVGPNDATGNIQLHVWIVILLVAVGILPTVGAILYAVFVPSAMTAILAIAVGLANGWFVAWLLGRVAIGYLRGRMPDVYTRIRYGQVFREGEAAGILDWVESTTLKGEQTLQAQRQKEKQERVRAR